MAKRGGIGRRIRKAVRDLLIVALVYPVCWLFKIRFLNVHVVRIGHLAVDTDCYLKAGKLGLRPDYRTVLLAPPDRVANACLLDYWAQYLKVVRSPVLCGLLKPLTRHRNTRYDVSDYTMPLADRAGAYEIQNAYAGRAPLLSLTAEDRTRCSTLLRKLGVPGDAWFVCVHAREDGYAPHEGQWYRNSEIADYSLAMRAIVDRGGWVIRMGDPTMKPIAEADHVIDYVHSTLRSEHADVILAASCRFFLGCTSGLYCVSHVFGKPSVTVNKAPLGFVLPHGPNDIGIPKLVWSIKEERQLHFEEVLGSELGILRYDYQFDAAGVRMVDNDPEDIEEAAREMLDWLDGRSVYTDRDRELQEKFKSLMNPAHYSYGSLSRVGRDFLRKHAALLE